MKKADSPDTPDSPGSFIGERGMFDHSVRGASRRQRPNPSTQMGLGVHVGGGQRGLPACRPAPQSPSAQTNRHGPLSPAREGMKGDRVHVKADGKPVLTPALRAVANRQGLT